MFINYEEHIIIKATQTKWHNEELYLLDPDMCQRWTTNQSTGTKLDSQTAEKVLLHLNHEKRVCGHYPFGSSKLQDVVFEAIDVNKETQGELNNEYARTLKTDCLEI